MPPGDAPWGYSLGISLWVGLGGKKHKNPSRQGFGGVPQGKCDLPGKPVTPFECGGLAKSASGGGQRQLVEDYGFPPKGDALHMEPPVKHVDTTRQTTLALAGSSGQSGGAHKDS